MPKFDTQTMALLLGEWSPIWAAATFSQRMQWVQGSSYFRQVVLGAQLDQYDETDLAIVIAHSDFHMAPASFRVELVAKLMKESKPPTREDEG